MGDRILILERDPADPAVWSYGLADTEGRLAATALRLRVDPEFGSVPLGEPDEDLWPTAVLLVRQADNRTRIVYDLQPWIRHNAPEPPPPPGRQWHRSTAGKAKGSGATLAERAERALCNQPRAAA